jgi:hypothetical protein
MDRSELDRLDAAWQAQRDAYQRRANGVTEADVRAAVQRYIDASYAYQRAKWGKVRCKFTVAGLFR